LVEWTEHASKRSGAFLEPAPAPGGSTAGSDYDTRFTIGLTSQDKSDLVAFLRSL
jgi:hypothetical protein